MLLLLLWKCASEYGAHFSSMQLFSNNPTSLPLQIGFLYLRYVLDPRTIWDWLQYYVKDHEVCADHSEKLTSTVTFSRDRRRDQVSMTARRPHGQSRTTLDLWS